MSIAEIGPYGAWDVETEEYAPEQGGNIVGGSEDPIKDYLRLIGRVPLLNAVQEVDLAKRMEAGLYASELLRQLDEGEVTQVVSSLSPSTQELEVLKQQGTEAKNQMLEANLRLVVSLAKRYAGKGLQFLDLVQEGNTGLIRAVEKFDYTKGYKFSTYATWWIRQSITRALADQARTIRIPVHANEKIVTMRSSSRRLENELGRSPTDEEVALDCGITVEKLHELQSYDRDTVSLNLELGAGGGTGRGKTPTELGDILVDTISPKPDVAAIQSILGEVIRDALYLLSEREAGTISMRFGLDGREPMTLEEIARIYGVTREAIRQTQTRAMNKLKEQLRDSHLRDFLGDE